MVEPAPEIVMAANGVYWRRYPEHLSMVPVSDDNDPVVGPLAVYKLARLRGPRGSPAPRRAVRLLRFVRSLAGTVPGSEVRMNPDRSEQTCLCGRGGIFKIGMLCPIHDDPEVEVVAKALAEWSSGMPWERRTPANREHWLRLARPGYAAMKDAHAELVKSEHAVTGGKPA